MMEAPSAGTWDHSEEGGRALAAVLSIFVVFLFSRRTCNALAVGPLYGPTGPGPVSCGILCIVITFNPYKPSRSMGCYPHFTDEEVEAQKVTCSG